MRRFPVCALVLALVASVLALASSSASAEPYSGTETGVLSARPGTFETGQPIELLANFPSDQASKVVTFFKEDSPGSGDYTSFGTDAANDLGNAYFKPVTVNAEQKMFARAPDGEVTQLLTLTPTPAGTIAPTGPDKGNLTQSPTTYKVGATISMTANFPNGTFPITLYKEGPADTWTAVATKTSTSSGNATFTGFSVMSADQRVFARKSNNHRTEIDVIRPNRVATLSIRRDCTGNNCGTTATAYGELEPAQEGRVFGLQRLSGSSWVSAGSTATTGADGKVQIQFSLSGVPQWTTRTYRLTSAAAGSSPSVTSNQIQFMPGPETLGPNVLRVDVENGVYPTTKGPEYTGDATLSVGGTDELTDVPLETFGVRGHSSVKFTKKPYKLKFLNKPPSGKTVFGMPRAKSWTLLASWRDLSLVREKATYDLGGRMGNMSWTSQTRFVEMFVNDQYRGSYLMTESVKIDADRVDVDAETGMIMETDGSTVEDSSLGFRSTKGQIVFAFKDPDERKTLDNGSADPEGVTTPKLNAIRNRINAFETKLYDSSTRNQHPDFIDVDSAIDYWLVREFAKDHDADFWRSHYFTWDQTIDTTAPLNPLQDGKFHFGPVWDFDVSAGNSIETDAWGDFLRSSEGWAMRGTGTSSGNATYRTHWFVELFKDPAFLAAAKARWAVVKDEFAKVHTTEIPALRAAIGIGAQNDRNRWATEPRTVTPTRTYDQEIEYLRNWYEDRFTWMDGQLS